MILSHEIVGSGEPLIFLHGLGADRSQSTGAFSQAAHKGAFQLIAVDFRSHGDSIDDSTGTALHFDAFADDIIRLMDHLELETAYVGGLSMGSAVTLNLALRYPERLRDIIILRPSWLDQTHPAQLELVAKVGHWIEEHGLFQSEALLQADQDFIALHEREPTVAASITPLHSRPQAINGASVLYKMYESRPFRDLECLSEISHRALVLDTTHDDLHPQSVAQQIAHHLPNVQDHLTLPPRYLKKEEYNTALNQAVLHFLETSTPTK